MKTESTYIYLCDGRIISLTVVHCDGETVMLVVAEAYMANVFLEGEIALSISPFIR